MDPRAAAALPARPAAPATGTVAGRLLPLGVDVHEHDTAVQAQLHALLEPAAAAGRAAGPGERVGAEGRHHRRPGGLAAAAAHPCCSAALAERPRADLTDLPLAGGDLSGSTIRRAPGEPADPFATARVLLPAATARRRPRRWTATRRHRRARALRATPRSDDDALTFDLAGQRARRRLDRLPAAGPLTPAPVAASSACIGLLRWDDGRWRCSRSRCEATVNAGRSRRTTATGRAAPPTRRSAKAEAKAGDAVAVLRERAGRLLRR